MKSLFPEQGGWFKGMLHAHSSASDGWYSPAHVFKAYQSLGYHFLCLTDHWKVTLKPDDAPADILHIPGVELDGGLTGVGDFHFVGIDVKPIAEFRRTKEVEEYTPRELVGMIRAQGGLAMIAHPAWNGVTWVDLESVADSLFALEVWNSTCHFEIARGLADTPWDDLLSRGRRLWGAAVDDAHRYHIDAGQAWVMAKAASLSVADIRAALESGAFYSSTGPAIYDFQMDETSLYIRTSPVQKMDMISSPRRGDSIFARNGQELTEHTFQLPRTRACYARIAITDSSGRQAWTNPVFFTRPTS